jgi:hypothetical protein
MAVLYCKDCGKFFPVVDYASDMDEDMWERISLRPSDRV